jgi:hypothetical protein
MCFLPFAPPSLSHLPTHPLHSYPHSHYSALHPPLATPLFRRPDFVQDLYLKELKAYKPKPVVRTLSYSRCSETAY